MPTGTTCEEFQAKINTLEERLSDLADKKDILLKENCKLSTENAVLNEEKKKLLSIIDNFSKGFAEFNRRK